MVRYPTASWSQQLRLVQREEPAYICPDGQSPAPRKNIIWYQFCSYLLGQSRQVRVPQRLAAAHDSGRAGSHAETECTKSAKRTGARSRKGAAGRPGARPRRRFHGNRRRCGPRFSCIIFSSWNLPKGERARAYPKRKLAEQGTVQAGAARKRAQGGPSCLFCPAEPVESTFG